MSHRNRSALRSLAVLLCVGLVAVSCGGTSKKTTPTVPDTVVLATTTTVESASTTNDTTLTSAASTTPGTEAPTTTIAAAPSMPLTGLPITDPALAARSAMVVKIDNHLDARPQSGLNEADIVFEENVELLTRFAAVFQSQGADPVGPIRSGRTQDVALLGSFNKPIFIWSGGNGKVTAAIKGSDLRPIDQNGPMFRTKNKAPHNLYSKTSDLYALFPADGPTPPHQFQYRADGAAVAGDATAGVKLSMDGIKVQWTWDDTTQTWLRLSDNKPHMDALSKTQLSTNNVVVLYVDYIPSPADGRSPEAQTIGNGNVTVYSAGKTISGTWTRTDRLQPFALTTADGTPILLTPGRTFVELARAFKAVNIPAGTDPSKVNYP